MTFSLQRTFSVGEHKQLQVRITSTNVTNHVNITNVNTVVNALGFGLPTGASGMRTLNPTLRFIF